MRQDSKLEIDDGWIYINGEVLQRVNVLFKRRFSPISWEHTSKFSFHSTVYYLSQSQEFKLIAVLWGLLQNFKNRVTKV